MNATAGLDGYGRSSYINDVVCRNRDANSGWTAASDGTLEERYYYCANWRGDHSALVTSDRKLHEMDKYSPYGVPFGLPGGDTNSDGDNDAADATQIQTWIDASAYDVRGDVDLDGDVDSADKASAEASPVGGALLGHFALSTGSMMARNGFAGSFYATSRLLRSRARWRSLSTSSWIARAADIIPDPQLSDNSPSFREQLGGLDGCPACKATSGPELTKTTQGIVFTTQTSKYDGACERVSGFCSELFACSYAVTVTATAQDLFFHPYINTFVESIECGDAFGAVGCGSSKTVFLTCTISSTFGTKNVHLRQFISCDACPPIRYSYPPPPPD